MKKTILSIFMAFAACLGAVYAQGDGFYSTSSKIRIVSCDFIPDPPRPGDTLLAVVAIEHWADTANQIWRKSSSFSSVYESDADFIGASIDTDWLYFPSDSVGIEIYYDTINLKGFLTDPSTLKKSFSYSVSQIAGAEVYFQKEFVLADYLHHPFQELRLDLIDSSSCDTIKPKIRVTTIQNKGCDGAVAERYYLGTINKSTENPNATHYVSAWRNFPSDSCGLDTLTEYLTGFELDEKYTVTFRINGTELSDSISFRSPPVQDGCADINTGHGKKPKGGSLWVQCPSIIHSSFTITALDAGCRCHIVSSDGEIVFSCLLKSRYETVDFRKQPPGVYFLSVSNGENAVCRKLIKR